GSTGEILVCTVCILKGNPAAKITDIEKVEIVFKDGVGYAAGKCGGCGGADECQHISPINIHDRKGRDKVASYARNVKLRKHDWMATVDSLARSLPVAVLLIRSLRGLTNHFGDVILGL